MAQLTQARKMEAIGNLAGGIAHEFNNALIGVSGNIELLKMELSENSEIDEYISAMLTSVHSMSQLTKQLSETNQIPPSRNPASRGIAIPPMDINHK